MVTFEFPRQKQHLYVELMRQLTGAQRVSLSRKMTAWEVASSRRIIAAANPRLSEEEVKLLWLEATYGEELAAGLREYMKRQRPAVC